VKIYNLPQDYSTPDELNSPVIIRSFKTQQNIVNAKDILHQNMIKMVISGKMKVIYADNTVTIGEGELVVFSAGNCLTSEFTTDGGAYACIVCYFTNTFLADFFVKYNALYKQDKATKKYPFITFKQDEFIRNYIQSLNIMLDTKQGFVNELKQLKLEELLLYIATKEAAKLHSLHIMANDDEDIQLRKTVESNIGNPVTVEDLAFLCNASLSTFKRKFNKVYGTSPQKWLTQQKMQLAALLLKHPNERAGLVYEKVGYQNHSAFIHAFKQQYGITPKEYQDKNLNF